VIVCFVDIGGIVDHHCFIFYFSPFTYIVGCPSVRLLFCQFCTRY